MGDVALGVLPVFKQGHATNAAYTRAFVQMLEAEGVESVWAVEHVVVAKDYEPRYSYSDSGRMADSPETEMPDPLEWLSFVAGCTERLRLGTGVLVLTLHQPAIVAKRVATLDNLSGGRLMLGVGSGWQVEEYAACGVPYARRGERLDDAIAAMRELWQPGFRTHHGPCFSFTDCESKPTPDRVGGPPIVIGGSTEAAARRVGRTGDGFFPYVVSPDEFASLLEVARTTAVEHGRDPSAIEITVWPASWQRGASLDAGVLRAFVDAGADRLMISAQESGTTEIDGIRDYIKRVQDVL
jgi:probable F420-dependent oxidoreductase